GYRARPPGLSGQLAAHSWARARDRLRRAVRQGTAPRRHLHQGSHLSPASRGSPPAGVARPGLSRCVRRRRIGAERKRPGFGDMVPWAEAGVGAVATQSFVDASYGPLGLELMRAGRSAPEALRGLLAADDGRDVRQVAMIDAQGRVAAHTGSKCIAAAGNLV